MSKKDSTEYLYLSTRVRALEGGTVGHDRMESLIETKNLPDAMAKLASFGLCDHGATADLSPAGREAVLSEALTHVYDEMEKESPDPTLVRLFRYPYDCNNVKSILKCRIRGLAPDDMMIAGGSVPVGVLLDAFAQGKPAPLPPHMAEAVASARDAYAASKNPQCIDFILDRACYADMLDAASATGVPLAYTLVQTKIDLTNLITLIRILRMGLKSAGTALLRDAFLPGGTFSAAKAEEWYKSGESKLATALLLTPYGVLGEELSAKDAPLRTLERVCDDIYMRKAAEARYVPFGPEVILGYLVGWEVSVKNMRMVLAGKAAGLAPEQIRERVRQSYV